MAVWKIAVVAALVAIWVSGIVLAWRNDARTWNGGIAPSGAPWEQFDLDSQGGRGYEDPVTREMVWIDWPVDRRRAARNEQSE